MLSHCLLRKIKYLFSSPDQNIQLHSFSSNLLFQVDKIVFPWQDGVCILEWHPITTKLLYLIKIRIGSEILSCRGETCRDVYGETCIGGCVCLAQPPKSQYMHISQILDNFLLIQVCIFKVCLTLRDFKNT